MNKSIVGKSLNHKLNDNFFNFLTDLNIKYFMNHFVIIKTLGTYQHLINMYYMNNKKLSFNWSDLSLYEDKNFKLNNEMTEKIDNIGCIKKDEKKRKRKFMDGQHIEKIKNNSCDDNSLKDEYKNFNKRFKVKKSDDSSDIYINNNKMLQSVYDSMKNSDMCDIYFNKESILLEYKYIYKKINVETMRNTKFLDIIKELIYYKIILEMIQQQQHNNNNNNNINNFYNLNYDHHVDNSEHEMNYLNKINEVIYFFIPFNITDFLLRKINQER
ncbi:conserved Plasmodium membrane protein, unknown function [Plasmodium sp. DRC-Itaito]|nr:conserved Plasmodium membrane protein, unknown function [Plasmodium sp. DRC-Itaito]